MAKFYTIQLDDIFLTDTGQESGDPCKLEVDGADALLFPFTGSTIISVDGTPINQVFETETRGRVLEIKPLVLTTELWTDIVALINTALGNSGTINIIGTGDIGNFVADAKPLMPRPFEAKEFKNGRVKNTIFRFITT